MADFIRCSICVSDIPKSALKQAKNGKLYLGIVVCEKKEEDQFGNTHYIAVSQTKEERDAKAPRVYIGDGKAYIPTAAAPSVDNLDDLPTAEVEDIDDLPF